MCSRLSKSKTERKTYISILDTKPRITLFHDSKEGTNCPCIRELSQDVKGSSSRVIFVGSVTSRNGLELSDNNSEVILVKEDCEIQCYDGEDLHEKWTSPPSALFRESSSIPDDAKIEYAQLTYAYSASQGIMKHRNDAFAVFPQEITEDGFNPALLILITKSAKHANRNLHIVSLPHRQISTDRWSKQQSVHSLLTSNLSYVTGSSNSYKSTKFSVHVSAGTMHQLDSDVLTIYDLTETIPKEKYKLESPGAHSFLRLSRNSIMISSGDALVVYNPKFRSRLATLNLDTMSSETLKRKRNSIEQTTSPCRLLSYFPRQGLVVALIDRNLVGIQVDGQHDRRGRPRMSGLLIDSLGCSINEQGRLGLILNQSLKKARKECLTLKPIRHAGSIISPWFKSLEPLEELFDKGEITEKKFDRYMEIYLKPNSTKPFSSTCSLDTDKRWAIYALSKIFTVSNTENNERQLSICFHAPDTFFWLIQRGYMTTGNIESGLRHRGVLVKSIPAGELTRVVLDLDPEMKLLRDLITNNNIETEELLCAIRVLMQSSHPNVSNHCAQDGPHNNTLELNEDYDQNRIKLTKKLAVGDIDSAEHQLKPGFHVRDEVLSLALSKLCTYPDEAIVLGLQKTYPPQTVVSMINMLRSELTRGGWTAKYLEPHHLDSNDEICPTQDNFIVLISTLLNCCVDVIGTTGWLFGESQLNKGNPFEAEQLILNLKNEISTVLEGIEEMVYLQSILSETIIYLNLIEKEFRVATAKDEFKPVFLSLNKDNACLPMGLKAEKHISALKINTGGETTKRTHRDLGDRKSRKVGKYSREQINV